MGLWQPVPGSDSRCETPTLAVGSPLMVGLRCPMRDSNPHLAAGQQSLGTHRGTGTSGGSAGAAWGSRVMGEWCGGSAVTTAKPGCGGGIPYLHVVDDGLEEAAEGSALLLRRLHRGAAAARGGRRRRGRPRRRARLSGGGGRAAPGRRRRGGHSDGAAAEPGGASPPCLLPSLSLALRGRCADPPPPGSGAERSGARGAPARGGGGGGAGRALRGTCAARRGAGGCGRRGG